MPKGDIVIVFDCGATNVRATQSIVKEKYLLLNHILIILEPIHSTLHTEYGMLMRYGIKCAGHQKKLSAGLM